MGGCPQVPDDLRKITKLDSDKVNRSQSTEGYRTPRWLIEERGNFTLLGELPNLEYLRIARVELGDWSFLAQCKKLRSLILPDTDFTDCRLLLELPLLEKVALPPKRKLQHREVLDTLKAKSCSPAVQEEQPFYRDEDYEDMAVVKGEDIHPDYQGSHEVRCVSASFHGKQPPHWRDFPHQEYQEDNWKNLSPEEREILAQELAQAVQKEKVQDFILSLEPWGEGHLVRFDRQFHRQLQLLQPRLRHGGGPLSHRGWRPVPGAEDVGPGGHGGGRPHRPPLPPHRGAGPWQPVAPRGRRGITGRGAFSAPHVPPVWGLRKRMEKQEKRLARIPRSHYNNRLGSVIHKQLYAPFERPHPPCSENLSGRG